MAHCLQLSGNLTQHQRGKTRRQTTVVGMVIATPPGAASVIAHGALGVHAHVSNTREKATVIMVIQTILYLSNTERDDHIPAYSKHVSKY